MEVTCIDDKNRPNEIPTSRWVKKKQKYTISKIMLMKQQGGIAGVKLEEINNDDLFPWTYFRMDRFGLTQEQLEKMIQTKEVEVSMSDNITAEERFKELIDGMYIQSIQFPNVIRYYKDNKYLIGHYVKDNLYLVDHFNIWQVLESEYDLNYQQVKELTITILKKHFNKSTLTTLCL